VRISGGAPKVELSTTDREITAHAGAVLLRATADVIGLGPAINAELRLKVRDRGLSEAESILGMTEALGSRRRADNSGLTAHCPPAETH
jgi:hypothetical protein